MAIINPPTLPGRSNMPPRNVQLSRTRGLQLVLAVSLGLVAALLTYLWLGRESKPVAPPSPPVNVIIAGRDIAARTLLSPDMLAVRSVPPSHAPQGSISTAAELSGAVTISPIAKGQPVTRQTVAARGVELGLAFGVPPFYRAVTVALDPVSAVAGFVKPGDHVDVLATFDAGTNQSVARTVLQDVTVLATGAQVLPSHQQQDQGIGTSGGAAAPAETPAARPQDIPNATLAVAPLDAEKLIIAATRGKLQLALRPASDDSRMNVPALSSSAVTGIAPVATGAPAQPVRAAALAAPSPTPTAAPVVSQPVIPRVQPAVSPPAPRIAPAPAVPQSSTITVIKGTEARTVDVQTVPPTAR
jgi:pilus assembly protein CpaB